MRNDKRKLRLISLSAAFVLLAGYSAIAVAACSPPSWWPSWLPYDCQER